MLQFSIFRKVLVRHSKEGATVEGCLVHAPLCLLYCEIDSKL